MRYLIVVLLLSITVIAFSQDQGQIVRDVPGSSVSRFICPLDGQVLLWDSASGNFKCSNPPGGSGVADQACSAYSAVTGISSGTFTCDPNVAFDDEPNIFTWSQGIKGNLSLLNQGSLELHELSSNGAQYLNIRPPASITTNRFCNMVDSDSFIPDTCVGDGVDDSGLANQACSAGSGVTGVASNTLTCDPDVGFVDENNGWTGDNTWTGANQFFESNVSIINRFLNFRGDPVYGSAGVAFAAPTTGITSSHICVFEDDANFIPDSCVGNGVDDGGTLPDQTCAAGSAFNQIASGLPVCDSNVAFDDEVNTFVSGQNFTGYIKLLNQGNLYFQEAAANGVELLNIRAPANITAPGYTCNLVDQAAFIPDSCVGDGVDNSGMTVKEADGSPSFAATTLSFDQSDGFTVTNSGGGVATIDFTAGGGGGGCPWNYVVLGSDFSTATNTDPPVTGFNFTPVASKLYVVEGQIFTRSANATIAPRPGISWPTGLTDNVGWMTASEGSAANKNRYWDGTTTQNATITDIATANVSQFSFVQASFKTGVSPSGTFSITLSAEGALGTVTMKANSWFRYKEVVNGAESCGGTTHGLLSTTHTDTASHTGVAGDIIYFDGSSWRDLPKGNNGQMLTLVGGLPRWVNPSIPTPCDETNTQCFFDDFNEETDDFSTGSITAKNVGPWYAANAGTGSTVRTINGGGTSSGFNTSSLNITAGSTAGGEACVWMHGPAWFGARNLVNATPRGKFAVRFAFKSGTGLSVAANQYIFAIGGGNTGSCNLTASTDGSNTAEFFYTHDVNGAKFLAVYETSVSGSLTCDTGITVATDTLYKGCIVASAGGETIDYYLTTTFSSLDCRDPDHVVGTPVCTITPAAGDGGGLTFFPYITLNKLSGASQRDWYIDYYGYYQASDTAR